jgi:uncharacterized protein
VLVKASDKQFCKKNEVMELKPLENKKRIEAVDALRGFALLGILIANIPFAEVSSSAGNSNAILNFLFHLLIDKKFISIFSILFGFGVYIQMKRAEAKNVNFTKYFVFRMLLLYAIGSVHAFVIWNGDILRAYAFGGIILMFVRKWKVKWLLITAIIFAIVITGITFIGNSAFNWRHYNYDYALANELPTTHSYLRYLSINFIIDPWVNFLKDMPITLAYTFGNMILGFVLAKIDFFNLPEKWNKITTTLIIQGLTFGLASSYIYYKITSGEIEFDASMFWIPFVLITGLILQSLMYISLFLRFFQINGFNKLLGVFKLVGKTSLSNYIFQSVFYLFAFYHCTQTLQLFGKLTLAETWLVGIIFFIIESVFSYLWLRNHTQGPLEYVWKKMSYKMALPKK